MKQIFMIETTKGTCEQELNMLLDGNFIDDEWNEIVQIREISNEVVDK